MYPGLGQVAESRLKSEAKVRIIDLMLVRGEEEVRLVIDRSVGEER